MFALATLLPVSRDRCWSQTCSHAHEPRRSDTRGGALGSCQFRGAAANVTHVEEATRQVDPETCRVILYAGTCPKLTGEETKLHRLGVIGGEESGAGFGDHRPHRRLRPALRGGVDFREETGGQFRPTAQGG
ncbi:MAG: hypothetical protein E5Y18_09560 [Mesorhizobium sp.]|nr:MAG: hypothetical protein E5Y18_09560 [Mesorhizobium sp.]